MNKHIIAFFASISCANIYAAPGFLKAVFSGTAYNGTSDIWSYTKAEAVDGMDEIYAVRSDFPETTTYAYGTYMELEGGVEYYFAGTYDDYVSVKVDDTVVIPQGGSCGSVAYGVIKFAKTGWHKFDFRVSNNGGPGGNTSSWQYGGIWMKRGTAEFARIENNKDGTKCVTEAPIGYESATPEYAFSFGTYSNSGKTYVQLAKCGGGNPDLQIPDQIQGYDVGQINDSCFKDNTMLRSISHWPSKLMTIGGSAFYGCTSLAAVEVPDTVTSIGGSAFRCCSGLVSVKLPAGLTATSDAMFMDCTTLETVTMPTAPTRIESSTFRNCSSLATVSVPNSVASIGAYAFYNCLLLPEFTLPDNVNSIGEYAFYGCLQFKNLVIPDTVQSIGNNAYRECANLRTVVLSENITAIPDGLFYNCKQLRPMTVPSSVISIGNQAFYGCESFMSFTIPENVTTLGNGIFTYCAKLESLVLPSDLTSIPQALVQYCRSFKTITIPKGVTAIGNMAFEETDIEEILLPDGLAHIGYHAFCNCKSLKSITIPASVKTVDNYNDARGWHDYPVFNSCSPTLQIIFLSAPPKYIEYSRAFNYNVTYPKEYGAQWLALSGINGFHGYNGSGVRYAKVVSSKIRENDPTIMDVTYKIKSSKSKVKVRVLAFEDGERSFAKVVRPETFVEGTGVYVGDNVTPNDEHTISWRVSSDWQTKLAKVKFEVLAMEGELVPLELMTIPESDQYGKMKISWNALSDAQLFDALLWLTASKDPALSFSSGVLRANGTNVAQNTGFGNNTQRESAAAYIFGKMGYQRLIGAQLTYANQETRLGLSPSGSRQYAYKIVP